MKKLLVTGTSGFLGWNVCREASKTYDVYGVYHSHTLEIENVKMVSLDICDHDAVVSMFKEIKPDSVIHCAAIPDPNACEKNPDLSYKVNVQASIDIAKACKEIGAALVFTSSDLVFDGEHSPYKETDPVGPISIYGRHKVEAENGMKQTYPQVTICRVPVMFGDSGPCSKSFIQPIIANLTSGKPVTLFSDEYRTTVSGRTAAQALLIGISHPGQTFHCGGKERISRYDFGLLLCKAIGVDIALVKPVLQKDIVSAAKRPRDVSFMSNKMFGLGYEPKRLVEQLEELECVRQFNSGKGSALYIP